MAGVCRTHTHTGRTEVQQTKNQRITCGCIRPENVSSQFFIFPEERNKNMRIDMRFSVYL